MFPEGYISCKEMLRENKEGFIIYFHVFEDSKDFITVYLTDSDSFLTAKIPLNELRRVASNVGVTRDTEILFSLKLSVKKEVLHFDEPRSEVMLPFCCGSKSSKLVLKFHTISDYEEKEKYMKFLLFQLARIAEKCDPSESGMSKLTTKTKNETILTHVPSLRPHKMPPKRRGTGMSIVNPGSKRIHRKPGVQYEEEDSDT